MASNNLTLVFTDPPPPPPAAHGRVEYKGSLTVSSDLFRQLLRFAPIDRSFVVVGNAHRQAIQSRLCSLGLQSTVEVVTPNADKLRELDDRVVVQSLGSDLNRGIHLRSVAGDRKWPVVGITHDLSDPVIFSNLLRARAAGLRDGDAVICCSSAAQSAMQALDAEAVKLLDRSADRLSLPVIPHGVAFETMKRYPAAAARRALGVPGGAFVFLFFGRLTEVSKADLKELIIQFWKSFAPSDVQLLLAGYSPPDTGRHYVSRLVQIAHELGVQRQVRIIPNPTEHHKQLIFSSANAFISPANSLQESFGISLVEAMGYSLPTIVTGWDGYRDIVVDGETGFLINTRFGPGFIEADRDHPFDPGGHLRLAEKVEIDCARLSRCMQTLAGDPQLAEKMGRQGRQRAVDRYNWKRIAGEYAQAWELLLSAAARSKQKSSSPFFSYAKVFRAHPSQ